MDYILFFPLFILLVCLPGYVFLTSLKVGFNFWERLFIGTIINYVFLTLIYYLLAQFHLTVLIFLILTIYLGVNYKTILQIPSEVKIKLSPHLLLLGVVFLVGIIGQLLVIAPSGMTINGNLVFWSSNGHDGSWHIALMNEIAKGFPLGNPALGGERIYNYHFFSDILPTFFSQYFHISNLNLYFRLFPFITSLLLGATAYILALRLTGNKIVGIWSVILTYFAGSFGYIVTFLKDRSIEGESLFWGTQIQSASGNPPQILSDIIVISILVTLIVFLQSKNKKLLSAIMILVGSLVMFKVYAAVVVFFALGVLSLWEIFSKKSFYILILTAVAGIISAVIYLPNVISSTSFLIFSPGWYLRTMMVEPSRINYVDYILKIEYYLRRGDWKSYLRIVQLVGYSLIIFIVGNLGVRSLGLFEIRKIISQIKFQPIFLAIYSIIIVSLVLPLLFIQRGVAANTSQFLQYFLLLTSFLAAIFISELFQKIKYFLPKLIISLIIVAIAIPTQVVLLMQINLRAPFAQITGKELGALEFLKNNTPTDSLILTPPNDKNYRSPKNTPDMWEWFDTSYVSAFSNRDTFLADIEQMEIMGYNYKNRLEVQNKVFNEVNINSVDTLLKNEKINYLYFPVAASPKIDLSKTNYQEVFNNGYVEVWKVN